MTSAEEGEEEKKKTKRKEKKKKKNKRGAAFECGLLLVLLLARELLQLQPATFVIPHS